MSSKTNTDRITDLEKSFIELANDMKWVKYLLATGTLAGVFQVIIAVIKEIK